MREIQLTQNKVAVVDDENFEFLNRWKWYYHKGYAVRKHTSISMHRTVLNTPVNKDTDHINRDTLDNRLVNLRVCNESENQHNTGKPKHNTSGYKGVYWHIRSKKWIAKIKLKKKSIHIGCFDDIGNAVMAYNKVALELHGEFAYLNEL